MADEKVIVRLELSEADLNRIKSKTDKAFKNAGESSGEAFSSGFGNVAKGVLAAAASLAIFTKNAISAASGIEDIEATFTTFLKSATKAKDLLKELTNFTATTPFQLDQVAAATKVLLAFGESADGITDRLRSIGDVAAGSGNGIRDLAVIFGQVRSATKLTGERLLQFQERGVNVLPALAKQFGILEKEVKDFVSKGKVSFKDFEKAFDSLSAKGGLFFGGTARQSKTLSGAVSTLKDNFNLFSAEVGKNFLPTAKKVVLAVSGMFNAFRTLLGGNESEKRIQQINNSIANLKDGVTTLQEKIENEGGFFDNLFDSRSSEDLQIALNNNLLKIRELEEEKNAIQLREQQRREQAKNDSASSTDDAAKNTMSLFDSFTNGFAAVDKSTATLQKTMVKFGNNAKKALAQGVGGGFAAMGKALVEGTNAMDAFTAAFLGAIGQAMVAQGTQFILTGIGYLFTPFAPMAAGLISAGAALAVAGGALSAVSSSISKPSGGATAGAAGDFSTESTMSEETLNEQQETGPRVSVNIQGDVLDSDETGMRIVELINQSVDDSSVSIRRGAIA